VGRFRGVLRRTAGLPGVMTAGMEMKCQPLLVELRFDFILDVVFRDDDSTEVARGATAFTAPHLQGNRATQRRQRQACRALILPGRCSPIRRRRSVHLRPLTRMMHAAMAWLPAPLDSFVDYAPARWARQAPAVESRSLETPSSWQHLGAPGGRRVRTCQMRPPVCRRRPALLPPAGGYRFRLRPKRFLLIFPPFLK
jgi:hypothetical protein